MRDLGVRYCIALFSVTALFVGSGSLEGDELPQDDEGIVQTQFQKSSEPDPYEEMGLKQIKPGSSSTALRKEALADLPLQRLTLEQRTKISGITNSVSLYRRLPTVQFEVDADAYRFFMQHPDVAVSTWRAMEISKFQLQETAPNFYHADAGDGSVGNIEVLYREPEDTLILCDGQFKSPAAVRPITAKSLMRFQASFAKQADGRIICTHRGDVFVEFPQHLVDAVARVISPVSHSIADRNFKQITLFVHMMSQMMERQPTWVEGLSQRMDGIADSRKVELVRLTDVAYRNAQDRLRTTGLPTSPISVEKIIQPMKISDSATPSGTPAMLPGTAIINQAGGRAVTEPASVTQADHAARTPTPVGSASSGIRR